MKGTVINRRACARSRANDKLDKRFDLAEKNLNWIISTSKVGFGINRKS
jgi:hypothetical protein